MNDISNFGFFVDKAAQTVNIKKTFAADLDMVWAAFTSAEILDQWWAPKPWASRTKAMDFAEGGRRFYAMVGPEGQEKWALQKYTYINPKTNFKLSNCFADENENPAPGSSEWDLTFRENCSTEGVYFTEVDIVIYNESLTRLEQMIEMGFKEGFTMALGNLDQILLTSNK